MIVYPVAELVGYFANSREAVGLVDPETLTVIYGNWAFGLSIEDFQLNSGKIHCRIFRPYSPPWSSAAESSKLSAVNYRNGTAL